MTLSKRKFGRTGWDVSEIGFGAWAIGGSWGSVGEDDARAALNAALDSGVTFIDTADVYGDGRSERIIRDVLRERGGERPIVATKLGRRLDPHVTSGYLNKRELEGFIDRSLSNLGVDTLDLVQLHCPPTEVYYRPEVFDAMDAFVAAGKIRFYGVSVEKVEEALKAIEYPNVVSVQIIYNMFRQRPADLFFREALRKNVAVIARVPLASGMLTGKLSADSVFAADDHRAFNRHGEAFDVGETFSGVDYATGLRAVDDLRGAVPDGLSMAQAALRWTLMFPEVTAAIPGARDAQQAEANARAATLPPLPSAFMTHASDVYDRHVRALVHDRW